VGAHGDGRRLTLPSSCGWGSRKYPGRGRGGWILVRMFGRLGGRQVRAQRRRLESYDPDERTRAAITLVKPGLTRRTATALSRYLEHEEDPRVRLSIALELARTNGGRSHRRRVRQLRCWTVDELLEHGHPVHLGLEQQRGRKRPVLSWRATAAQSSPS